MELVVGDVELAILRQINVQLWFSFSVGLLLEAQTPKIYITAREGAITSEIYLIYQRLIMTISLIIDYYSCSISNLLDVDDHAAP